MRDLYEARSAVKRECLRLAMERATAGQIRALTTFLEHTPVRVLVALDESFHLQIADMAGNAELRRMLASLNERIRFIRWIDMETVGRDSTQKEHQQIARARKARGRQASVNTWGRTSGCGGSSSWRRSRGGWRRFIWWREMGPGELGSDT